MEAIYSKDLDALIDERRTLIIDLRSPEEYQEEHIQGAYNIPYETSKERLFRLNKGKNYVLYCERGLTSFRAAREMSGYGYQVKSLINGIRMYKGKYLIRNYGRRGDF
ncbi:MAG: rhodanese-like domain-containing protein [Lachnospiraceae bacterium]|nr:rhodanese-like domain-containing protein [Lachnospiraceae bacterium]